MNYANECQPKDVHLTKTLKYMLDLYVMPLRKVTVKRYPLKKTYE